ncbi:helix-turn-helix domain-containing protein [Myxococcus sp. CA051A]|uniref:helix-turn-helix domain-containing protein n=1 Tax=unclassified Myxococcus TaxID=2648731 RepID=UPI00157B96B9|nr:helix-turn-helix domain-containing protein [Myxococcus sp. CA040A]NTX14286.1 helix-turn-helix domain-containing protein [Myxococcus sp. CA056]NTX41262.1 helix-turn-helix domain-containing protein [Myxococcus sp. CA033]NTX54970.1 helix-turn-helix domain-containing protein [Myxococcus sp. CA039A]NTX67111.1 helix-turn-helix domain-containing protein [Myxococcus sp. CA051A]
MDHVDFGKYLSQQRDLRGMSLEDVARETKIPPTLIAALEAGQVERLPSRIFVVNYIKAYAQVIGLSPEEAVLRYEEVDRSVPSPSPAQLEQERRKRAYVGLSVLLVALALGVYLFLVLSGKLPSPLAR